MPGFDFGGPPVDPNNVDELLKNQYPAFYALAQKEPEVKLVVVQAAQNNWPVERTMAALQNTNWYKTHNDAQRKWELASLTDPAESQRLWSLGVDHTKDLAQKYGFNLDDNTLGDVGTRATEQGWNDEQTIKELFKKQQDFEKFGITAKPGGLFNGTIDDVQSRFADYAVPFSYLQGHDWGQRLITGAADKKGLDDYLKTQAKSLFPAMAPALDQGMTVKEYAKPYEDLAIKHLNLRPGDVNWQDQKWNRALNQVDPKTGNRYTMSLSDWTKNIMTDPMYDYDRTPEARNQAASFATSIAKEFGAVGGSPGALGASAGG